MQGFHFLSLPFQCCNHSGQVGLRCANIQPAGLHMGANAGLHMGANNEQPVPELWSEVFELERGQQC